LMELVARTLPGLLSSWKKGLALHWPRHRTPDADQSADFKTLPTVRARSRLVSGFCSISRPASRRPWWMIAFFEYPVM
jgi:hypothetical protein